jgi:hypothetical protein
MIFRADPLDYPVDFVGERSPDGGLTGVAASQCRLRISLWSILLVW